MCARVSREDVDKPVENANGDVIGTVIAVESDRAVVEPKSGVMDSVRAALGWERAHEDTIAIRETEIESVSADVIRLAPDAEESTTEPDAIVSDDVPDRESETDDGEPESAAAGALERDRPGDGEAAGDEGSERIDTGRTADRATDGPSERVADPDAVEGTRSAAETDSGDDSIGSSADGMQPAGGDAVDADREDPATTAGSTEDGPPSAADERRELEAPSAADETVDTDRRDGLGTTERHDDTAEDESTAGGDVGLEGTASNDANGAPEPASDDAGADADPAAEDERGVPDEAASTVDLADERGATDGVPDAGAGSDGESLADADASGESDPEPDPLDPAAALGSPSDSLADISDGLEDDAGTAADPADELRMGTDIESVADTGETDDGPAAEDDLAAELNRGPDLESVVDRDTDDRTEGSSGAADDRELTDALHPGSDLASVADADRRSDTGTEPGPAIDPKAIRGRGANTEDEPETVDRRIVTERGSTVDRRPGTAGSENETARETLPVEPVESAIEDEASGTARTGTASPLTAVVAAQRTAMEPSRRTAELGLAVQRQNARTAIAGLTTLGRQQLRLAEAVASAPVQLTAAMTGAGDTAASDRERARRLELVDGLDAMYRRRLAAAGITSLEDLARADSETVADAAGVTERRAAGWIEQVRV